MKSTSDDALDLLAAYALDALGPEEMEQVSALLREHPELQRELAELRAAAALMPHALDAEPSPDLRQRVLDHALGRSAPAPARPSAGRWQRWTAGLAALSAALTLALALVWGQLNTAQAELARVQNEQRQLASVMAEPDALIAMGGQGRGAVVRGSDGAIVMAVSLPQLQAGRVYQLWFIQGQSAPIPSETFTVDAQGRALVTLSAPQAASADTFAVTEEPHGGSQAPTTEPVLAGSIATTEG